MMLNEFDGRILIVDDSPESLKFMAEVIEPRGATVLVAMTGEKALEVVTELIPDVILLDAVMPGIGGFETCRRMKMKSSLKHVPIIFMTGLSDTAHIVEGLKSGGVDYLVKPIAPDELVARIHTHLTISKLAHNAYLAMDEAQRFLAAIDNRGKVLWSTPQATRILDLSIGNGLGSELSFPASLTEWIDDQRNPYYSGPRQFKIAGDTNSQISVSYIGKAGPKEYLLRVIEENFQKSQLKLSKVFGLTGREAEVLTWISNGKSNRDIGTILGLSPRTINKHLEHIHKKLGVENRTTAAAMAINVL
jgi:DNA-binding NarL/FixJ family response regulator